MCFVMSMSARDGVVSPEGWLCTRMSAVACSSSAPLDHLAHVDGRVIDRTAALHFVRDQVVLLVEEQDAELLDVVVALGDAQVVDDRSP